jgi:hypothetical protein
VHSQADLTLDAYQKHKQSAAAAAPLTEREEEIQRLRKEEVRRTGVASPEASAVAVWVTLASASQNGAEIGITTKKAHVHGVAFPVNAEGNAALAALAAGTINYVQLVRG